ncbi:MAG: hypothetical protein ACTJLM_03110 [Ehrlichia sp.]
MYRDKIIEHINVNSQFTINKIDFSKVNKNPSILFMELTTIPMFHKDKLIVLANGEKFISQELKQVLNNNIGNNYVITISEELPTDSTLRQYYENSKNAASVGCYKDDNDNSTFIISDFLKKIKYNSIIQHYSIYVMFYLRIAMHYNRNSKN